ncbi:hypothetical protein B0H10DRAFT_2203346 [Mycena sp. CBHHK59/15]|nr:hypothetical protein B0H10DRAFT_2203346 [Mycena sp. CBHHK59/15]
MRLFSIFFTAIWLLFSSRTARPKGKSSCIMSLLVGHNFGHTPLSRARANVTVSRSNHVQKRAGGRKAVQGEGRRSGRGRGVGEGAGNVYGGTFTDGINPAAAMRGQGDPALTWTGGYGHEGKGKGGGGAHHGRCSVARSCSVAAASGVHAPKSVVAALSRDRRWWRATDNPALPTTLRRLCFPTPAHPPTHPPSARRPTATQRDEKNCKHTSHGTPATRITALYTLPGLGFVVLRRSGGARVRVRGLLREWQQHESQLSSSRRREKNETQKALLNARARGVGAARWV